MIRNSIVGLVAVCLSAFSIGLGCGDDEAADVGQGGRGGDSKSPSIGDVTWESCNAAGISMECASISVPLDWADSSSERINHFVRRIPSRAPEKRGQIWLLVGGPGVSGAGVLGGVSMFAPLGFDVYVPDYRGVGKSTGLSCGERDGEGPSTACMAKLREALGEGLRHFSTTGAAMDLGKTIEAVRSPGEKVFLYGGSYGAFLGNRYLNLFPDQADGVIFGGICPPAGCSIHGDRNVHLATKLVFDLCGADEFCKNQFGGDPWSRLHDIYAKLEGGHCADLGADRTGILSSILGATIPSRTLAPVGLAVAYRADRCDAEDVAAIRNLGLQVAPRHFDDSHARLVSSDYLYWHIVLSEFWEEGLTVDALRAEVAELLVAPGQIDALTHWRERWPWPSYETPEELLRWAPSSVPALLINGAIDATTPTWDLAGIEEAFSGPGQHFVELPFSGHGSHHQDPCGIVTAFLRDPLAEPDRSCVDALGQVSFEGSRDLARQALGSDDLWENGTGTMGTKGEPSPDPRIQEAIESARRIDVRPVW